MRSNARERRHLRLERLGHEEISIVHDSPTNIRTSVVCAVCLTIGEAMEWDLQHGNDLQINKADDFFLLGRNGRTCDLVDNNLFQSFLRSLTKSWWCLYTTCDKVVFLFRAEIRSSKVYARLVIQIVNMSAYKRVTIKMKTKSSSSAVSSQKAAADLFAKQLVQQNLTFSPINSKRADVL